MASAKDKMAKTVELRQDELLDHRAHGPRLGVAPRPGSTSRLLRHRDAAPAAAPTISVPEPRMLTVQPFDPGSIKS